MGDLTYGDGGQLLILQQFLEGVQDLIIFRRIWHKYHLSVIEVKIVAYYLL